MLRADKADSPVLFFLHIPKTAGSSFYQILHREYGTRLGVVADHDVAKWDALLAQPDHGIDCVFGHYWFGLHRKSIRPYEYATLVREPVEAILSYYFYIAQQPSHWLHPFALSMTMADFFNLPEEILGYFFRDYQSVSIAGKRPASFDQVKQTVCAHYPIVGITELYHESAYLMKRRFGWGPMTVYYANATPNRPSRDDIDPAVVRKIESLVPHDAKLYRYAKARLLRQLEALPSREKSRIERFKANDSLD